MITPPTSSTSSHTPTSPGFQHTAQRSISMSSRPHTSSSSLLSSSTTTIGSARPPTPPLLRAPPNQPFSTYLRSWTTSDMTTFLSLYKCGQYTDAFARNDITGKVLLDLDIGQLKGDWGGKGWRAREADGGHQGPSTTSLPNRHRAHQVALNSD